MKTLAVKLLNGQLGKGLARVVGEPKSLRFRLARDTVGVMVIQAISMGLTFATSVVLARLLGVREFGLYSLGMSVLGLLVVPATLGFPQLLVREIAAYRVKDEWNLIRGLLRFAQRTSLLASMVIAILGSLFLLFLDGHFSKETMQVLILAFIALPFWAILELQGSSLRGFDHILVSQWTSTVMRPLCFLLILGAFWLFLGRKQSVYLALELHILATVITSVFAFYFLQGQLRGSVSSNVVSQNASVWVQSALFMAFQSFLNLIPQHAGTLVLAWMRSPEEVGFYKVAYQVASLIPFGLMAVNTAIAPTLAQLYAVRDQAKLCKVMLVSSIMATIFALPLVLLFTLGGKRFLLSIFGRNFGLGAGPLLILTLGQFIFVALGPLLLFLVMTGREDKATLITGTTAALNVVMNLLFIPVWGPKGAALATSISLVFLKTQALFYIIVSEKRHGTR